MEVSNYTSKGQGALNTVLGSIGTAGALGVLNGGLGGIFGSNCGGNCSENQLVNRYEAGQNATISELRSQIALRDSNTYTDSKLLDLYKFFDGELRDVKRELCDQRVYNATNTAAIGCIQGQVAQLMSLTKLVIPNGSVCPGWGNVTVTPATAPTT